MKIVVASDHGGFALKNHIYDYLRNKGLEVVDCGTFGEESVDYPVYAGLAADKILSGECGRGILFCGTGIGISMAANRFKGIRAAVCESAETTELTRRHNDANLLCLGGRIIDEKTAERLVDIFLDTPFDGGERHSRRIEMLG